MAAAEDGTIAPAAGRRCRQRQRQQAGGSRGYVLVDLSFNVHPRDFRFTIAELRFVETRQAPGKARTPGCTAGRKRMNPLKTSPDYSLTTFLLFCWLLI